MLERYYIQPCTVDRIRESWIGALIEQYVDWLTERGHPPSTITRRIPVLMRFGGFARVRGATHWEDLPAHVNAFVEDWLQAPERRITTGRKRADRHRYARLPVEQMR